MRTPSMRTDVIGRETVREAHEEKAEAPIP
jgi:hypothetical protein